jgi:hypothetical protein
MAFLAMIALITGGVFIWLRLLFWELQVQLEFKP